MGRFTRTLVVIVGGGFLFVALIAAMQGAWGAAIGLLLFGAVVLFFGGVGEFVNKYPPQHRTDTPSKDLFSILKGYRKTYPGWQGKLVTFVIVGLFLLVVGLRLVELVRSMR